MARSFQVIAGRGAWVRFESAKGACFFHSTLVKTLFYEVLFGVGAVVPTDADADGGLRLAHCGLASGCAGSACVVRTGTEQRSGCVDWKAGG